MGLVHGVVQGLLTGGAGVGVGSGARAAIRGDASLGIEEEFDWLNKGLEVEDFANNIFDESSPPRSVPSEPNTVPSQPTTNIP